MPGTEPAAELRVVITAGDPAVFERSHGSDCMPLSDATSGRLDGFCCGSDHRCLAVLDISAQVLECNEEFLGAGTVPPEPEARWSGRILQLPHPQTGRPGAFALCSNTLQEITWFKPRFGSWLAGNNLIADGSLYLCSPVDPLFLALPLLEASRRSAPDSDGVFQQAQQICQSDDRLKDIRELLESCLSLLCDRKEAGGDVFYRLKDAKVIAWLRCKVKRTVAGLQGCGAAFSSMDQQALTSYAVGILGEYLSPIWVEKLKKAYGFDKQSDSQPSLPVTQVKRTSSQPDFAQQIQKKIKLVAKEREKLRAAEKRQEQKERQVRRETAGMKKLSSFFSPKG